MSDVFVAGPHHIETASGGYLDLKAPDPANIVLADVAQGLANTCRFAGQCTRFYSVAEHAVFVAARLERMGVPAALALAGLHHDDAEAFLGDVTRPLKSLIPYYKQLEHGVWTAIAEALGLSDCPVDDPLVKEADEWALAAEAHHLLPSRGRGWFCDGLYDTESPYRPVGVPPADAALLWQAMHLRLTEVIA